MKWIWRVTWIKPNSAEEEIEAQKFVSFWKAFPGAVWTSIKHDWGTAFGQMWRVLFDSDMSDEELQSWGESVGGVGVDALFVWSGVGWLKGLATGGEAAAVASRAGRSSEIARALGRHPVGVAGLSEGQVLHVLRELHKGASIEQALEHIGRLDLLNQPGIRGMLRGLRKGLAELPEGARAQETRRIL